LAVPSSFTRADVEKIAALAQLALNDAEIDLFTRQLGGILDYANQVQQFDTAGVEPTAAVVVRHAADRPDVVHECLDRADALGNAPDPASGAGFFKVPRVIG
jgi:aspartyl-tRNA(Asn)/glutamyl-tRNA(Gln) amidotransferase subunit C